MSRSDETVQLSLFQLDNYGPWTVTPSPRRETDLQALQSRLYADLADFVSGFDGYAFYDRFDNLIAVTNGISIDDHRRFQQRVRNRYPITVSIAVGTGATPVAALGAAGEALQAAGSAQDGSRTEALVHAGPQSQPGPVTIAHFDVVDVTGEFTDQQHPARTTLAVQRATLELATVLYEEHESIARFVGGDNIIAVCPTLEPAAFDAAREHVYGATGIDLQVGIGRGETAHEAGYRAKLALEECRETGVRRYEYHPHAAAD